MIALVVIYLSDSENEDPNVQVVPSLSDESSDVEYQPLVKRIAARKETLQEVASSSTDATRSRSLAQGRSRGGRSGSENAPEAYT